MATAKWDQVSFTRGEIDPRVQMRVDWQHYYKSAKKIRNCVCIPQGGVTRRWGTSYVDLVDTDASQHNNVKLTSFLVNDNIIYLLLWEATGLKIYLEGTIVATIDLVDGYPYKAEDIINLRFSQVAARLLITDGNHRPYQIFREAHDPLIISATGEENSNTLIYDGETELNNCVLPVQFQSPTDTVLPSTTPAIFSGRDYFIRTKGSGAIPGTTKFSIYSSSYDAATDNNPYIINNAGNGAKLSIFNNWTIKELLFIHYPTYDFLANYLYSTVTFTITKTPIPLPEGSGEATITCTGRVPDPANPANTILVENLEPGIFNENHKGGLFVGGGYTIRIFTVPSSTTATGEIIIKPNPQPPDFLDPLLSAQTESGDMCLCAEKAFSDLRGWPRCSTVYQGRVVLAGTARIPNGQWLSNIGLAQDYDESETNADNAISSYPSSGSVSYIKSMTSARSLLVHSNTGNYSTSIQNEMVLTPTNYMLVEHNKFGIGDLQPTYIDNQLFFVDRSGNNIINMCWDFIQGNYVTNSISIAASSLVRYPIDMAAFSEPQYLDGFYVLFVNYDGTMCVLQTLREEDILAFSLATTNSYLVTSQNKTYQEIQSSYRKVVTAQNMCWFLTSKQCCVKSERTCMITSVDRDNNVFLCNTNGEAIDEKIYRCTFSLEDNVENARFPITTPVITPNEADPDVSNIYFVKYTLTTNGMFSFKLYSSMEDASFVNVDGQQVGRNEHVISDAGIGCSVSLYLQKEKLFIEQVNFDYYTDFSTTITKKEPATVWGLDGELNHLNGQVVNVIASDANGNQYVLSDRVVTNGKIVTEIEAVRVNVGLPFQSMLVPLPPTIPEQPGMLFNPTHIRTLYISYYNTVGATIMGYGIPVQTLNEIILGAPINTENDTGVFTYAPMEGWEGAIQTDLQIIQSKPLPMTITGLSYVIDT